MLMLRPAFALVHPPGNRQSAHAAPNWAVTPLPAIDLVNESLEALAATVAAGTGQLSGAVFDTASDTLAGHPLERPCHPGHDPAPLFAAIPEHSAPASVNQPFAEIAAYAALRTDCSAPELPYDEPLDVARPRRVVAAIRSEATTRAASWWTDIAYPSIRRENKSSVVAR